MDFVLSHGADSTLETDTGFQFSLACNGDLPGRESAILGFFADLRPPVEYNSEQVEWENWNAGWQQYFKPTPVGNRLLILPEWEKSADETRLPLFIKPGMAFGTGTHETTQLCLELLEECIRGGEAVLDLGSGTGILGMAALLLGADHVDGVDNDEQITENLLENLQLNELTHDFNLQISTSPQLEGKYDLLVVNIIKRDLLPLLPEYFNAVKKDGTVIIGGLLREEDDELRTHLARGPWQIQTHKTKNEWIAYQCRVSA